MSKQLAITAFKTVERRVAERGDFYTEDGRMSRVLLCSQLAYELQVGTGQSFQLRWNTITRNQQHWEGASDVMSEVLDELGLMDIDQLFKFVKTA